MPLTGFWRSPQVAAGMAACGMFRAERFKVLGEFRQTSGSLQGRAMTAIDPVDTRVWFSFPV
jgi:hypothetical protein